jgi:hypothetical protein
MFLLLDSQKRALVNRFHAEKKCIRIVYLYFVVCTCLLVEWDRIKLQEIGNATKVGTQM